MFLGEARPGAGAGALRGGGAAGRATRPGDSGEDGVGAG